MALNINGTTGISGVDGSASAPAVTGTDSNTGINFGSDTVNINTGGSTRATVDSSGNLNIPNDSGKIQLGTSSDLQIFHDGTHSNAVNSTGELRLRSDDLRLQNSAATHNYVKGANGGAVELYHNNSKKCSTTTTGIEVHGSTDNARISFGDAYSDSSIGYVGLNRFGIDSHDGLEVRDVSASYATRLKIDSSGKMMLATTSVIQGSMLSIVSGDGVRVVALENGGTGTNDSILFRNANGDVGAIKTSGSSTSYNTSSDYRLKENVVAISDGITRLKTLKPSRFNFIADAETTVDGFLAHEVTAVPEAITGTKDETEDILYTEEDTIPSGKKVGDVKETVPKYQGIDQSKLVPLLTAALQEAVAKIEVLETKVAALEAA